MARSNALVRAHSRLALLSACGAALLLWAAAPVQAACVVDVALVASDQMNVPALAGYELAGYWDVAGEGVGGNTKGSGNMGLFYKLGDDPSKCLQTLCLKASESADPGTPAGYARAGMWDADAGGSWGRCGLNVAGAPLEATRGSWMLGLYTRSATTPGAKVIESIYLTASNNASQATMYFGYEPVAYWDVDGGGARGMKDNTSGSYMMTLSVKFAPVPAPPPPPPPVANVTPTPVPAAMPVKASSTSTDDWNPTVDARNVTYVNTGTGAFQQLNATQWQEWDQGVVIFNFTEKRRDASTVYLYDESRNMYLELNLTGKQIKCCGADPTTNGFLYPIKKVHAGYVPMVSKEIASARYYYRLRLKTSNNYYLRVWDTGRVGSDQVKDDLSTWLLIPTGQNLDEYWLFNKGAKGGRGQVLARPAALTTLNQWDFLADDKAQRFKVQFTSGGYFRLIEQASQKAVSTRWNEAAFVWDVNPTDAQQEFALESVGLTRSTDALPGYVFWNLGNDRIKNYFTDYGRTTPDPSMVNIKKIVFVNASSRTVVPAVHHVGCGGAPWRSGMPQCWYSSLGPNEKAEFEVSDYVKNAAQIWMIIGGTAAIAAGIAVSIACAGLCSGAVAAALGPAAAVTAGGVAGAVVSIQLGALIASGVIGAVDLVILGWAPQAIITSAMEVSKADDILVGDVLKDLGVNKQTLPIIRANLGEHVFAARGNLYKAVTDSFYIEETNRKKEMSQLFYSNGTVLILIE
jgi:hypothetical protein